MLLEVALQHATKLLAPFSRTPRDEVVYTQLCADLAARMDLLAQSIAHRADGPRLAADWLIRLVRIKTQLNAWAALPASMAMKAMIETFGSTEESATTVIESFPRIPALSPGELQELRGSGVGRTPRGVTPGMDIPIARMTMKACRQDTKSFDDELQLFENLSLLRDPGLHNIDLNELPPGGINSSAARFRVPISLLHGSGAGNNSKSKDSDYGIPPLRTIIPLMT